MRTTILIEGLPYDVSVQAMSGLAEDFGRLSRVVVEHDREERGPEAICWVTYQRGQDAARAMRSLDGQVVGGNRVAAHWAASG